MQTHNITVIVPVYNECESLDHFKQQMDLFLDKADLPTKVLFVNDGSTDNSQEIIDGICQNDTAYQCIQLRQNVGLSGAMKAGIDMADTEYVAYIDADVQTHPEDFNLFIPHLGEFAMVNGIRAKRKDTIVKKLSSKIANTYRRLLINDGIEDTCCPLKIIKADYAKRIPFFDGMHRFLPALIQLQGGKVKQIPVRHFPRYAGTAKYNLWNRIRKPFIDTFAFMWMRNRYINYHLKDKNE